MLIPFKTTAAQRARIPAIVAAMTAAGVPEITVRAAENVGSYDGGVFDLMELWMAAASDDQQAILKDLQNSLDDYLLVGGF